MWSTTGIGWSYVPSRTLIFILHIVGIILLSSFIKPTSVLIPHQSSHRHRPSFASMIVLPSGPYTLYRRRAHTYLPLSHPHIQRHIKQIRVLTYIQLESETDSVAIGSKRKGRGHSASWFICPFGIYPAVGAPHRDGEPGRWGSRSDRATERAICVRHATTKGPDPPG